MTPQQIEALKLALEAFEEIAWSNSTDWQRDRAKVAITTIKEALAQPEEEPLHPVHIGVDVTREGTAVTAFYRKPDAVMEMFYSQFHPMAQPEQEPVGVVGTDLGGTHLMYGSQYVGKTPDKKTAIFFKDVPIGAPLYTTPPQRKPFSDEEMKKIWYAMQNIMGWYSFQEIARAIEQAHGIKENT